MFDLGNRFGRIKAFRADLRTVHNGVAAIELERIFEIIETLTRRLIAAID